MSGDAHGLTSADPNATAATAQQDEPSSLRSKIKSVFSSSSGSKLNSLSGGGSGATPDGDAQNYHGHSPAEVIKAAKRTLYTANAGDARAVLSCVLLSRFPTHSATLLVTGG